MVPQLKEPQLSVVSPSIGPLQFEIFPMQNRDNGHFNASFCAYRVRKSNVSGGRKSGFANYCALGGHGGARNSETALEADDPVLSWVWGLQLMPTFWGCFRMRLCFRHV